MSDKKIEVLYPRQGTYIKLYLDDGSTVDYETRSIRYELLPTGIALCTYNTPKTLHALTFNQRWEMFFILEHMKRDEKVKVAVWTATGERAFSSGADLKFNRTTFVSDKIKKTYLNRRMGVISGDFVLTNETLAFWDFPKPSIVAVNGIAVGGAVNMALMNFHDLVICSEKAKFLYPFPKLGFIPELGSSLVAPSLVGLARAKEIFMIADWFDVKKAYEMGLVNKIVKPDELLSTAMEWAEKLVVLPPDALRLGKKVVNSHLRASLEETLAREQELFSESMKLTGGPLTSAQYMKEEAKKLADIKAKL